MKTDHIEETKVVIEPDAKKPSKKWLTYILWIAGAVGVIFLLVFFGIFSRIWEWIQHDPYFTWSLTKLAIGVALILFFWPKARKTKKTAAGLATIATEFKPLSLGAFGVYAGIIMCLWALLPVIIPFIFSFLGKYGWWVLAFVLVLVAIFFLKDKKKKIAWLSFGTAIVILLIVNKGLISSTLKSFRSDDAVTAKTDSVKTDVVPPTESTDTPVGPVEVVKETTTQQPVPEPETPVEAVVETPTVVAQPVVDTAAIAASDATVKYKKHLRDSLQKAKVLSDVTKALDVEIAQLKLDLAQAKKASVATTPCPNKGKGRKNRTSSGVQPTFKEVVSRGTY